jgi:hypothetical protein
LAHDLDLAAQIFKPLRRAVRGMIGAIWKNASLAQKLTVWQKQGHEHARAGAAWVGGNAARAAGASAGARERE